MHIDGAINELARRQLGLFTRAQAISLGATDGFLRRRVDSCLYRAVRRGVYAVTSAPESWQQDALAVCLGAGEGVVASHRTAAAIWEFPGIAVGRPLEFSSPRKVRAGCNAKVHRVASLPTVDICTRGAVPVTTATRTLLDLTSVVEPDVVEIALDDAIRRGLTSVAYMFRRLDQFVGAKRIRAAHMRQLLSERTVGEASPESPLETRVIQLIRRAGLPRPERQFEVDLDGGAIARLDLAYPLARVGIEVDGYEYHSGRARWERDLARRNRIEALGWRLIHVTDRQLRSRKPGFLAILRGLLSDKQRQLGN